MNQARAKKARAKKARRPRQFGIAAGQRGWRVEGEPSATAAPRMRQEVRGQAGALLVSGTEINGVTPTRRLHGDEDTNLMAGLLP